MTNDSNGEDEFSDIARGLFMLSSIAVVYAAAIPLRAVGIDEWVRLGFMVVVGLAYYLLVGPFYVDFVRNVQNRSSGFGFREWLDGGSP